MNRVGVSIVNGCRAHLTTAWQKLDYRTWWLAALLTANSVAAEPTQQGAAAASVQVEAADSDAVLLKVAEPFLEIATGPGRGYPVFYVAEQGEAITIHKQFTDWYLVTLQNGKQGWAHRAAIAKTLQLDETPVQFREYGVADFAQRQWEITGFAGRLLKANSLGIAATWQFTENLGFELQYSQVLGNISETRVATAALTHQMFPRQRFSPYWLLAAGQLQTKPRSPLIGNGAEQRTSDVLGVGIGLKTYLLHNVVLVTEVRRLQALTDSDHTEDLTEWKFGFAVFY